MAKIRRNVCVVFHQDCPVPPVLDCPKALRAVDLLRLLIMALVLWSNSNKVRHSEHATPKSNTEARPHMLDDAA